MPVNVVELVIVVALAEPIAVGWAALVTRLEAVLALALDVTSTVVTPIVRLAVSIEAVEGPNNSPGPSPSPAAVFAKHLVLPAGVVLPLDDVPIRKPWSRHVLETVNSIPVHAACAALHTSMHASRFAVDTVS